MSKKTSIIIAVRNNFAWTNVCLDSLLEKTNLSEDKEVIIIDNGSRDKVREYLRSFGQKVKETGSDFLLIENSANAGSYYAWNQGINASSGEYICISHNDCVFSQDWLDNLLNFFDNYESEFSEIGVVSPSTNYAGEIDYLSSREMMDMYTNFKYSNKTPISIEGIYEILDKTYRDGIDAYAKIASKNRKKNFVLTHNIATFCFLTKKSIYDKYGQFDEDFFPHTYAEKLLKFKLDLDGIMTACCYDSFVHHNGNTTSDGIEHSLPMIEEVNKGLYENKMKEFYEESMTKTY